jgi:ribosomal protein S11
MRNVTKHVAGLAGLAITMFVSGQCLAQTSPIALTPGGNSIFAGTAASGGYGTSKIAYPSYIAVDNSGNVYWPELPYPSSCTTACTAGNVIRMATPAGVLSVVAGQVASATTAPGFSGDNGSATSAILNTPRAAVVDSYGNIFISDTTNNRVRVVYSGGTGNPLTTLIPVENSAWSTPVAGNIYTLAGNGSTTGGTAANTTIAYTQNLNSPRGLWASSNDDIYITSEGSNYVELLYNGGANASALLTAEGYTPTVGYMYYIGGTGSSTDSVDGSLGKSTGMPGPIDVAVDSSGNVYVAEYISGKIRKIMAVTVGSQTAGDVYTIGGQNSTAKTTAGFAGDGGLATAAAVEFNTIRGLSIDAGGNLYVADQANYVIRKIDTNGYINTIAGIGTLHTATTTSLPATAAEYSAPYRAVVDPTTGNLFIADYAEYTIDKVAITALAVPASFGATANAEYTGSTAFGSVALGAASTPAIANISNISASPVTLSGITIPTGFVQLTSTTTPAGTLVPGTAFCNTTTALAPGTSCTLEIIFAPTTTTTYTSTATVTAGSSAISIPLSGTGTVTTPVVTLADGSITSVASGTSITFTATLSPTTAPGMITFYDGSSIITGCSALIPTAGTASCAAVLPVGSDSITAYYTSSSTGYANNSSSAITVTVTSNAVQSTTVLTSSATSANLGTSVTLTATVTGSTSPLPTGAVSFFFNGNLLGSSTLNGSAVATLAVTNLPVGSNSITASYGGDSKNLFSNATTITVAIFALRITAAPGVISTTIGTGTKGYSGDGGLGNAAKISTPFGLRSDTSGNIYVVDANNTVRMVSASTSDISTFAGVSTVACASPTSTCGDGGVATSANINAAHGLATDTAGNVYIADTSDNRIRMVYEGGTAATALLAAEGISSPTAGYIYTIAGNGSTSGGAASGTQAVTQNLSAPREIWVDGAGNVYIADFGLNRVRVVYAGGSAAAALITLENTTVVTPVVGYMYSLAGTGTGTEGVDGGQASATTINGPSGVVLDASNNLYVLDSTGEKLRLVSASTGNISTFAGTGTATSGSSVGDGLLATAATFSLPRDLWIDWAGNVYVADTGNSRIRKIDGKGYISTVAGPGVAGTLGNGGAATSADLNGPYSIALDNSGNLLISDGNTTTADVANYQTRSVSALNSQLAFPSTSVGSTSILAATISNVGTQSITLSGYSIPTGFTQSASGNTDAPDCTTTTTLAPAADCTLQLTFAPTAATSYSGTISVGGNAGTAVIALSGTGVVASTTATLTVDNASPNAGVTINFTATVTSGSGTPTGTIILYDNISTPVAISGAITLNSSGVATFATNALTPGPHSITAVYSGAAGFLTSTSSAVSVTVVYNGAVSTTLLSASTTTPKIGQSVTFTATVTGSTSPLPTGIISFFDNGNLIGTQSLNGSSVATFTSTALPFGTNSITASYPGDSNNLSSVSSAVMVTVSALQIAVSPGVISTIIGNGTKGYTGDGGSPTAAEIYGPFVERIDSAGNLYLSDSNNTVRKVTANTSTISTIAGNGTAGYTGDGALATAAEISLARGLDIDAAGDVYISDTGNNRIRIIYEGGASAAAILAAESINSPKTGYIYTIAGGGTGAVNTLATNQALYSPRQIRVDSYGNIYIADFSNDKVRVVYAGGTAVANLIITESQSTVTTATVGYMYVLGGTGSTTSSGNGGLATLAGINGPHSIAFDAAGNLYIAEYGSAQIREISISNGYISTIAGNGTAGFGGDGGVATLAELDTPRGVWLDWAGNIYIADTTNNRVRKVDGKGYISTIAGYSGTVEGDGGAATSAYLNAPHSVTLDNSGNLMIADNGDNRIRSVNALNSILTFSNTALGTTSILTATISNVGSQTVTLSGIAIPSGYSQSASGNTDAPDCTTTTTLAPAASCSLQLTFAPTVAQTYTGTATVTGNAGTVSIAISGTGVIAPTTTSLVASSTSANVGQSITFTATVANSSGGAGTPTGSVSFYDKSTLLSGSTTGLNSSGVAVFSTSSLSPGSNCITAVYTGNTGFNPSSSSSVCVVVTNPGAVATTTTVAANPVTATLGQSVALTVTVTGSTPTGNVSIYANGILVGTPALGTGGTATLSLTTLPSGINSITASYGGDANNFPSNSAAVSVTVSALQIAVTPGIISTVVDTAGTKGYTGDGGLATAATIYGPLAAKVDASGNLYLSDSNNTIRKMTASTGNISTIAGTGTAGYSGDNGPATLATVNIARGLAVDAAGNVYISDSGNNRIRVIYAGGSAVTAILNAEGILTPAVGSIYTIAGGGTNSGSLGTQQSLNSPRGIAVDGYGNVYIADFSNYKVRVLYAAGSAVANLITTEASVTPVVGGMYVLAGSGSSTDSGDGAAASAAGINAPHDVGLDTSGNLYILEFASRVRLVNATNGNISSIVNSSGQAAGFSGDGGPATAAQLNAPRGIWLDWANNLYIADTGNNRVRRVDGSGNINTIAGGGLTVSGDGGSATAAVVNQPYSVTYNNSGNMIIATYGDNRIRSVNPLSGALTFPNTGIGVTSTLPATLTNLGQQNITLGAITVSTGFSQVTSTSGTSCSSTTTLAPEASCILQLVFSPIATGSVTGTATVASNDGTISIALSGTGVIGSTNTVLSASSLTPLVGASVTLTATVTSTSGIPNGSVNFYDNGVLLATQVLNAGGVAAYSTTTLVPGSNSITAVYTGNTGFTASSSGAVAIVVTNPGAVTTTTSLTSSASAANLGQSVTLTATVAGSTPTGTVSFYSNSVLLGASTVNASGVATLALTNLPVGTDTITAGYSGDANNYPSTSAAVTVTMAVLQVSVIPGIISTVVDTTGAKGYTGDGAPATGADIYAPLVAKSDVSGNLYLSDSNNTIRKVTASTGYISTIAGTGTSGFSGDGGAATQATINAARGLAVDTAGNVYISDSGNNRLRIIYAGGPAATAILRAEGVASPQVGSIYTLAGGGTGANGTLANNQALYSPRGVFVDSSGNVYIADLSYNRVRVIYASGSVAANLISLENSGINPIVGGMYVLAGTGSTTDSGDGSTASAAGVDGPHDVGLDANGNLYILEYAGAKVREINALTGNISTIAGTGTAGYTGDGGAAINATFTAPRGLWVDWAANVYIADTGNNVIRKIDGSGNISTIAGSTTASGTNDGGAATAALLSVPYSVALDSTGDLIIATFNDNRVRSVSEVNSLLSFPVTTVGSSSSVITATLANIGGQPIIPSAINVPTGFTLAAANGTTDCVIGTAIASGLSCTLRVSATPTQSGLNSGTMTVTTNATNAPLGVVNIQLNAFGANPNTVASVVTLTVAPAANAALTAAAVDVGQTVTLTAVAASVAGGPLTIPTGKVIFQSGSTTLGTVPLTGGGIATLSLSNFPLGTSSVTAIYDGDTVFGPSLSSAVTVSVYTGPGDFSLGYGNINVLVNGVQTAVPDNFATVTAGSSALYILTATSLNGFDQGIALSCSGLPANASCSFSPALVTPIVGTTYSFGLAINTTNVNVPNGPHAGLGDGPIFRRIVVGAPLLALLLWLPLYPARIRRRMRGVALLFVLCLSAMGVFTGCSNSPNKVFTPAGTYTVTINGLANNITHSETVTLTVQ